MTIAEQQVAIALGSNIGARDGFLAAAVSAIAALPDVRVSGTSTVSETVAVGPAQADYLNQMLLITTTSSLGDVLEQLHAIEARHGRLRVMAKGPRTLDLDIVWASGTTITTDTLLVPHPGLIDRPFWQRQLAALIGEAAAFAAIAAAQIHRGMDTSRPYGQSSDRSLSPIKTSIA